MSSEFDLEKSEQPINDLASFQFEPHSERKIPRWRHGVALFILMSFITGIAWIGFFLKDRVLTPESTMLPADSALLFVQTAVELLLFGAFWGAAWLFSRASIDDLFLRWRGTWENAALGLGYSIGLRFVLAGVGFVFMLLALLSGLTVAEITQFVKSFSPSPERIVSTKALSDPLYRLLMLTWISFIVAGLREELWRIAVIASCTKLLTPTFSVRGAQIFAIVMSSLFFGMAHYVQGWLAVVMTAILGLCLGAITLVHRSIWPAVIAHGAFDALTFLLLPLASGIKLFHG